MKFFNYITTTIYDLINSRSTQLFTDRLRSAGFVNTPEELFNTCCN